MFNSEITTLKDLKKYRSAPELDSIQLKNILKELRSYMQDADWFTVGIMAPSSNEAIANLKEIESYFNWESMKMAQKPSEDGPVFLKANQKTGDIYIRVEFGLGEGILLSSQHIQENKVSETYGPLPLGFFNQ